MLHKPVTHVIFDMDGLLLDTERLYTEAIKNVASEFNKEYTWDLKVRCMGTKGEVGAQLIIDELQLPLTLSEYLEKVTKQYDRLFPTAALLPGAESLVKHLYKNHIPIAIASGGSQDSFQLKTKNHKEFVSLFNHVVLASSDKEVKEGKPSPEVFLVCAQRFPDKPQPHKCLVFEDAPNGVLAANAAGMQVVIVPDARLSPDLMKGASCILKSLEDFKPQLFGLPPFENGDGVINSLH